MLRAARPYWRIPAFALLTAALAFAGSFLFPPTYASTTRLLIHGADVRFLSASGQDTAVQRSLIDSKTLTETYAGMATSRSAAIAVVDELHLDRPDTGHGPVHALKSVVAWTYRCGRAFVTHGYCAKVPRRERAIQRVQEGVSAAQLGMTSGDAAGRPGAFILELSGSGETGEQARDVTDALADHLVRMSGQHAEAAAAAYVSALEKQVEAAGADVRSRSAAVERFEDSRGISAADEQQVLDIQAYSSLRGDLRGAEAELADSRAQLASIDAVLGATDADATSKQRISTGRSDTTVQTTEGNPVFSALQSQRNTLVSRIAGLRARVSRLNQQIRDTSPTTLNADQSELAGLLKDLDLAREQQAQLTGQVQQARTQLATDASELTRLDTAGVPSYPVAPKRYLYLALGLLLGGLAGAGLTWSAARREPAGEPDEPPPADEETRWVPWEETPDERVDDTLPDIPGPSRVREPAPAQAGGADERAGRHVDAGGAG
ncbi:GNVR domain-containing protein [Micromonospora sp. NBS 11-29]|uniref:GNVR domain-containing protein n=1 Tax=Micromonospora sp. NBS 11-29 TaxID=1960879 RepID=UPI000B783B81|nr:GNVR domain-containing protein [Micromonospora sp. NBS 11-29]